LTSFKKNSIFVGKPLAIIEVINSDSVNDILLLAFVTFECIEITSLLNNDLLNLGWLFKSNFDPEILFFLSGLYTVCETVLRSKFWVGPFFVPGRFHGVGCAQLSKCSHGICVSFLNFISSAFVTFLWLNNL
jgi:hypothetical protein